LKASACRINVSFSARAVQVGNFSSYRTAYYLNACNTVRRIHFNILWLMRILLRSNLRAALYGDRNATVFEKIHVENSLKAKGTESSQSTTNKMRRFSIYLFLYYALHVSDGFSVHHQELKTARTASGICQPDTAAYC